ncbi:SRPBCC domain-containing protein [uncultured Ruegeria sp.]|uniref:SRPBCC family protein n=1 Tax=uncultured Ruegeria sp. TaxID=259304 RepID=UPI0026394CE5|nr:SRPBCC domain-containing protein [uncultured Ruegeria sp.]
MTGFSRTFEINASAEEVYQAITMGITHWWTTGSGSASQVGTVFATRFGKTYNHIKVSQLIANQRVEWDIEEHFHDNESLTRDDEWTGTKIHWNLSPVGETKTRLSFTHEGLVESMECSEICEAGWDFFLFESLKTYLESGKGQPFQHE